MRGSPGSFFTFLDAFRVIIDKNELRVVQSEIFKHQVVVQNGTQASMLNPLMMELSMSPLLSSSNGSFDDSSQGLKSFLYGRLFLNVKERRLLRFLRA